VVRIANCELRIANCELRIANCELRIANCELRIANCDLRIANCELRIANCELRIANCELRIANCELRIANCELRIANCEKYCTPALYHLQTGFGECHLLCRPSLWPNNARHTGSRDRRSCRPPSAVCRLRSAVCGPPSAVCRPPSAVRRLPSAVRRPPSAVGSQNHRDRWLAPIGVSGSIPSRVSTRGEISTVRIWSGRTRSGGAPAIIRGESESSMCSEA
jgi:hypothetical protein